MARIPDLRMIKPEDFDGKDQNLISKLAFPINNFMQQVVGVFKNGIDFTNLNQQINTITVSVDASGHPLSAIQFKYILSTKPLGIICINATNQSSVIRFPSAQPFISYTINSNVISITNIAGLPIPAGQTNSDTYQLTLLVIGTNVPTA